MIDLPELLAQRLRQFPRVRRWVVAFSGGVDSRVLLELCARILPHEQLLALHVNHRVQAEADLWAERCASRCAALGVPFHAIAVDPGSGSEADLREARYAAFRSVLRVDDGLLLAHHADDQVETLFLRLLRGAGVRGLAAMPWQRPLGSGLLYRPLLDQPRARLEQWARGQGFQWIEDPSNGDDAYDRNWLRQRLLPQVRQRWPQLARRVTSTTIQLAETSALLEEVARQDLQRLQPWPERLSLTDLSALSRPRQRNLLRHWIHRQSGHHLQAEELQRLEREVIGAREDALPALKLGPLWLRRYRHDLYLLPELPAAEPARQLEIQPGQLTLTQGTLMLHPKRGPGLAPGRRLRLDYRRGGERLRPLGRGGSVTLKQLFQEAGVPPWWRSSWPLLFDGEQLVAVAGICLCEGGLSASGLAPSWQPFGLSAPGCFGRL